jgi:glycosyltransferase involved in cell wall biosynthesis
MRISIITVVYNNAATIEHTIQSVLAQDYEDVEHVIVDGASKDGTLDIINKYKDRIGIVISEKDKGMYDAMNKGIRAATGAVIGILNSDDFFHDDQVLSKVAAAFKDDAALEATIGDIIFVKEDNTTTLRHYNAQHWRPSKFAWGYMPPHPSFFCKKELFDKYGYYQIDYKIAADYELLIRFLLVNKLRYKYLPVITTKMRMGGKSTKNLNSIIILNKEIKRGLRENKISASYMKIYSKYFFKPFEFFFNKGR